MKRLLLALLLVSNLLAQTNNIILYDNSIKGNAVSLNGSTKYASNTPNLLLTGQYSLSDDFSDGNYNGWTVSSGAYTVDTLTNPLSSNRYNLKCTTAGVIYIPCNQAYGSWEFDIYKKSDANQIIVSFISRPSSARATGSYSLLLWSDERAYLNRNTTDFFYTNASYFANSTWYRIKITRNWNGQFYVYIKGGSFGSNYVLVSVTGGVGANPATDNTYTSSNYFVLDSDADDRITNIQCEYGEGSLDLNGYGRIKYIDDIDFEGSNVTWAGHGNHSVARSTTDKHAGTYSLAMTSTDVGDATTNYIELPATSFNTIEAGKKYTKEIWARGTGILGSTLLSDGGFETGTNADGWTAASATPTYNDTETGKTGSYCLKLVGSGSGQARIYADKMTVGATYKLTFKYKGLLQGIGNNLAYQSYKTLTNQADWTTVSCEFVCVSNGLLLFWMDNNTSATVFIDDISLKRITLPSLTIAIGNQTKTVSSISCVPGTFTKVVFNFLATASEVGQPIKIYANQADVIYLDDASLTQAYDCLINFWASLNAAATGAERPFALRNAAGQKLLVYVDNGNSYKYTIWAGDEVSAISLTGTTAPRDDVLRLISVYINRIGNAVLYVNGVSEGTPQSFISNGGMKWTGSFQISGENGASVLWKGNIGEFQYTRFTDISTSNVNASTLLSAYNKKTLPKAWINGTKVLDITWKGANLTEVAKDKSQLQNNLTLYNILLTDILTGQYFNIAQ